MGGNFFFSRLKILGLGFLPPGTSKKAPFQKHCFKQFLVEKNKMFLGFFPKRGFRNKVDFGEKQGFFSKLFFGVLNFTLVFFFFSLFGKKKTQKRLNLFF